MALRDLVQHVLVYRHAYTLAMSASMGSIFYGWDIGLIGGVITLPSFKHYFGTDQLSSSALANLNGNIVAVLQAGSFFGALFTGYFSSKFGRKPVLLVSGIVYVVGSILQCIVGLGSGQQVALRVLYLSRFIGGVGVGMVSALVPSYVSECVPRSIRGRCTGMVQLANNIGIMLSFWVNFGSSLDIPYGQMQWRVPFIVQIIPGIFFIFCMIWQPESPRWLVEHGKYDRAAKALAYASGKAPTDPAVLLTLEEIKDDFAGKELAPLRKQFSMMFESRPTIVRSVIPALVMFAQQWTGTNAINYFSPVIFSSLGLSGTTSSLFATGIYGVVKVISVALVLAFAVERIGRKNCLIAGGIGQGLMMLWLGGFTAIHPQSGIVPASYVSLVAVYLYAVFYCVGWGPVPWVVASEVAPNHVRTAAMSLAIAVNWLFSFTISKLTPIMLNQITYGTYILFGVCCITMAVCVYVFLPETAGYALEDIRYLFENDMAIRALQDAPGGRIFLGGKRAAPVEELREMEGLHEVSDEIKEDVEKIEVSIDKRRAGDGSEPVTSI